MACLINLNMNATRKVFQFHMYCVLQILRPLRINGVKIGIYLGMLELDTIESVKKVKIKFYPR